MDEILASIHRMIVEGEDPAAVVETGEAEAPPAAAGDATGEGEAEIDIDADFIAAGVAAILQSAREPQPEPTPDETALRAGRGFVDGFSAGDEDVALVDAAQAAETAQVKVENAMSEQQRAAAVAPAATGPRPAATQPAVRAVGSESDDRLISEAASQSVSQSFEQLSRTILSQNPRTLEDLVRDMMRPMVRSWLDQNLPRIAERLVKQEIERITRGDR